MPDFSKGPITVYGWPSTGWVTRSWENIDSYKRYFYMGLGWIGSFSGGSELWEIPGFIPDPEDALQFLGREVHQRRFSGTLKYYSEPLYAGGDPYGLDRRSDSDDTFIEHGFVTGNMQTYLPSSAFADNDGDGLTDRLESALGLSGSSRDSVGDGVWDSAEYLSGYDPGSAGDTPGLSEPPQFAPLELTLGDPSDSHSVDYALHAVDDRTGQRYQFEVLGTEGVKTKVERAFFRWGHSYTVTLRATGGDADYDYEADLKLPSGSEEDLVFIEDPDDLLREYINEDANTADTFSWKSVKVILVKTDISGCTQGPNGTPVFEFDEDNPDNLILTVNDDFDEGAKSAGFPRADWRNDSLNPALDPDFIKVALRSVSGLNQGALRLKSSFGTNASELAADFFVNIFTADGATKLGSSDFEVNLSNPQGPLASLATGAKVTLLIESFYDPGREGARLIWKYENGSVSTKDELHFHIINVDIKVTEADYGFDRNKEGMPPNPALMVPLLPGGNRTNQVKVITKPSNLVDRIKLEMLDTSTATTPQTLSASTETITINGVAVGETELVAKFTNGQNADLGEATRMYVDVKNRLPQSASEFKEAAIFRVRDADEVLYPQMPYTNQAIEDFLNNDTWGKQANVFSQIVAGPTTVEVDYDADNDQNMDAGERGTLVQALKNQSSAGIHIYLVSKMDWTVAAHSTDGSGKSYIFIANESIIGSATPLSGLAQEMGHAFGVPEALDDEDDPNNVMSDPQNIGSTHIRRIDWNAVNPKP